jgi:hypothetical protein
MLNSSLLFLFPKEKGDFLFTWKPHRIQIDKAEIRGFWQD